MKHKQIGITPTPQEKQMIMEASKKERRSFSGFVLHSSLIRAKEVLQTA
jgi:uncharacterized protein (DUF1778 family)